MNPKKHKLTKHSSTIQRLTQDYMFQSACRKTLTLSPGIPPSRFCKGFSFELLEKILKLMSLPVSLMTLLCTDCATHPFYSNCACAIFVSLLGSFTSHYDECHYDDCQYYWKSSPLKLLASGKVHVDDYHMGAKQTWLDDYHAKLEKHFGSVKRQVPQMMHVGLAPTVTLVLWTQQKNVMPASIIAYDLLLCAAVLQFDKV